MSEQKGNIFRKKTVERIKSPEQLDQYLRVTRPGVWIVLLAVLLFFVGLISWAVTGSIDTTVDADVMVHDKRAVITEREQTNVITKVDMSEVGKGTDVLIDGENYQADSSEVDEDGRTVLYADTDLPDGKYTAQILVESISAIRFLFGSEA